MVRANDLVRRQGARSDRVRDRPGDHDARERPAARARAALLLDRAGDRRRQPGRVAQLGADGPGVPAGGRAARDLRLPARRGCRARRAGARVAADRRRPLAGRRPGADGLAAAPAVGRRPAALVRHRDLDDVHDALLRSLDRGRGALEGRPRSLRAVRRPRRPAHADGLRHVLAVPRPAAVARRSARGDRAGGPHRPHGLGPPRRERGLGPVRDRGRAHQLRRGDALPPRRIPGHAPVLLLAGREVVADRAGPLHAGDGVHARLRRRALRRRHPARLALRGDRVHDRVRRLAPGVAGLAAAQASRLSRCWPSPRCRCRRRWRGGRCGRARRPRSPGARPRPGCPRAGRRWRRRSARR